MLTLFKPWHSGNDLRADKDTLWHDAFSAYIFTAQQEQVMNNFMIKYECNDARDDFSAQRKKMEKGHKMPMNMDCEDIDDLDTQHYEKDYSNYHEESEALITAAEALAELSSWEITRRSQQKTLATTVNAVGWLDDMDNKKPAKLLKRMNFSEDKSASQWKQLLTDKKQSILDEREAQADKNEKAKNYKIVGKNYFLSKDFKASNKEAQKLIDDTATEFSLNEAQECTFRIVANHAVESNGEQLKMYLGGMAGTGKSQVIKALGHFFAERKKSYRFMCLASTGAAAALIGGSTYYSVLCVNRSAKKEVMATLIQARAKLQNVDYVFVDEISMVDCHALYTICSRMYAALSNTGQPFRGLNMILAGDFAQLAPTMGGPALYDYKVGHTVHTTNSHTKQESSIGKAVWHQFTTVVILRENIRQKSLSLEDMNVEVSAIVRAVWIAPSPASYHT